MNYKFSIFNSQLSILNSQLPQRLLQIDVSQFYVNLCIYLSDWAESQAVCASSTLLAAITPSSNPSVA